MFHVKHILVLFLLNYPLVSFSQVNFKLEDKDFIPSSPIDSALLQKVDQELSGKATTTQEKSFFYWSCFLRRYPEKFLKEIIIPFTAKFPEVNGEEAESLKQDLKDLRPLSIFSFNKLLRDASFEHASDLSKKSGPISHTGSDGRGFSTRMQHFGFKKCASENIYTGKNDGLLALIMLLLDIGLENPGHRKNILNPNHVQMGVSIRPHHTDSRIVLVQVLGCG